MNNTKHVSKLLKKILGLKREEVTEHCRKLHKEVIWPPRQILLVLSNHLG
jgi:hypothetical protein